MLYTNHFLSEYSEALTWYDEISKGLGDKFQNAFYTAEKRLLQNPLAFSFLKGTRYRRVHLKSFPYKMVYRPEAEIIYVIALIHTARSNRFIKRRLKNK